MTQNRRTANDAGFTLIELLAAFAVLSLAAAMLVSSLGVFRVAMRPGKVADLDAVTATQRLLRTRLERIIPIIRTDSLDPVVDVRGRPDMFSFASTPFDREAPGEVQRYRLLLNASGELMLYSASGLDSRIDLNDPSLVGWRAMRLFSNVQNLKLSYYGPDRFARKESWQSYWIDRQQPPALVRIQLRFRGGGANAWPDQIVRLHASVNAACRIVRNSGRCEAA